MKLLHTSAWHLGRALYGRKRYEEFEAFLDWLAETLDRERVDALLVAGDVFDTSTPSNRAQELYYRFLCRAAASCCRHVVVIAGNHDSPSFLNAPGELLRALDVHVFGLPAENPEDEVLLLENHDGSPELIVCAVPYLRERFIRTVEAGESVKDKEDRLIEGIRAHFTGVCAAAAEKRNALEANIPVIVLGHLFTAGGRTVDGDGVRELYVGSLAHVTSEIFPESFDYLALGHLHVPQKIDGSEFKRYSGSPLPIGFGEADREKSLCLVEFRKGDAGAAVTLLEVPVFQPLERLRGSWEEIRARLRELAGDGSRAWLEIVYDGEEVIGNLRERLDEVVAGTPMEILRVKNDRIVDRVLSLIEDEASLDDMSANEVFERCLAAHDVPEDQRPELHRAYRETIASLAEEDTRAE